MMPNGRSIFLIDTPGFNDTYRTDTEILREIADWLAQAYAFKVNLTGLIYLHCITDTRIGGSGMKNMSMFRKLCGPQGLGSVVLATTMWSRCPIADAERREKQLAQQSDLWQSLTSKGARIFRHDRELESGQQILEYLINRAQPITLDIQREMVDQKLDLGQTGAGKEVQGDLEKMQAKADKEMRELKEDMKEALAAKDMAWQEDLRRQEDALQKQNEIFAQDRKRMQASNDQLRKEMKEDHARETAQLKRESAEKDRQLRQMVEENSRSQAQREATFQREMEEHKARTKQQFEHSAKMSERELEIFKKQIADQQRQFDDNKRDKERKTRDEARRIEELEEEAKAYKAKADRSNLVENFVYTTRNVCPKCETGWVSNDWDSSKTTDYCKVCKEDFDV
jgi:hypothetical protein